MKVRKLTMYSNFNEQETYRLAVQQEDVDD